ncbi:hypothetical protein BSL78_17064 [Apostichopus japonicus]|uniref:Uncharacterized protein n=1 Tax=Stichopus japonicus TaxID=307972 RepID=A0A2G8KDJ8_STIJA|nr:hypothetical protein BSL78_17064 [Apostichopus japonicus]
MDSEAETVFDGDEGRSTPSSSQSTDLFDDDNDEEDDGRVMEVSDESGSRPDDTATWSRDSNSQHLLQHIVARTQNVISQNIHSGRTGLPLSGGTFKSVSQNKPSGIACFPFQSGGTFKSNQCTKNSKSSCRESKIHAISQSHQRQTVPRVTLEGDRLTASENERRRNSLSDFKLPNDDTKKTVFDDDTDSDDESFVNGVHGISAALYRLLLLTGLDSRVRLTSAYFTHGAVTYLIQGI